MPHRAVMPSVVVRAFVSIAALIGPCVAGVSAQGRPNSAVLPSIDDKTGTNPLNIQSAVVVRNDFRRLPDALFHNQTLYRQVIPLKRRTMSAWFEVPFVVSDVTGRTEFALGDVVAGGSWIPWIQQSAGLLLGAEAAWATATNEALGTGRPAVSPFAQIVFVPSRNIVVAAGYQQRRSIGGDDERQNVSEGVGTLYFAWRPAAAMWVGAEPQLIIDYERDQTSGRIDVEWGRLIRAGIGTYVRPGLGIGTSRARPFDWKLEVGFRVLS